MAITPAEIAAALGRPTPTPDSLEFAQWSLWITDALMLIEARLGDPAALNQTRLDYVVRSAVVAQVMRPDDATDVTVSVDDASVSRRYSTSTGRVTILPEWWELLTEDTGDTAGATAYAVDTAPARGRYVDHADICALNFGANYCSCGASLTAGAGPLWETADPVNGEVVL